MLKTELKHASPRIDTCQNLGACRLAPDCACLAACKQPQRQCQRLAPGVIDGPYLRRSYSRQLAIDMLVSLALIGGVIVVVDLAMRAHAAGWF